MYRHNPQTRRLTELVARRRGGRVRIIRAAFGFVANDPANVRLSAALEGGALMDVGCYCVSGARLIAGEPERVAGEQALGGDGVDVAFAGVMRFPDDITAHFDAGLALASQDLLEVVGDEGTLRLTDPWHCRRPGIDLIREDRRRRRIETEPANSYRLEAENMSAAIRGEAPLLLGREDAVGQARAIEALYEAADNGRDGDPILRTCPPARRLHWARSSASSANWRRCRCASSPTWQGSPTPTCRRSSAGCGPRPSRS